jgi:hypothetical protein
VLDAKQSKWLKMQPLSLLRIVRGSELRMKSEASPGRRNYFPVLLPPAVGLLLSA